jgi:hypothetical protein
MPSAVRINDRRIDRNGLRAGWNSEPAKALNSSQVEAPRRASRKLWPTIPTGRRHFPRVNEPAGLQRLKNQGTVKADVSAGAVRPGAIDR